MADLVAAAAVPSLQKPHPLQKHSVKIQSWKKCKNTELKKVYKYRVGKSVNLVQEPQNQPVHAKKTVTKDLRKEWTH